MDFANWGEDQPRVPAPDPAEKGVRMLVFKAPRRMVRVADTATQTPTGSGCEDAVCITKKARGVYAAPRAPRAAAACGPDDATEEEDSVTEEEHSGFSDPAAHRAEYLRAWTTEREGLRKVAQAFGRHWDAKKRAERGAMRGLPRGHLVALVAEEDDAQQELLRQSVEFGDKTDYAEWLGTRPSTPAGRLKCRARREAALLPHLPAKEEIVRRRIIAKEGADWEQGVGGLRASELALREGISRAAAAAAERAACADECMPRLERLCRSRLAVEEGRSWAGLSADSRREGLPPAEGRLRARIAAEERTAGWAESLQLLPGAESCARGGIAAEEDAAWVPRVGALRLSALPLAERSARRLICSDSGGALCLALAQAEGGPRGALAAQEHERWESLREEHSAAAAALPLCGGLSGLAGCGRPQEQETQDSAWSGILCSSSFPAAAEQFATQHMLAAREAAGELLGVQASITCTLEGRVRDGIGAEEAEAWVDLRREMQCAIAVQAGRDCVARARRAPSWSTRNDYDMTPFAASPVARVAACNTQRLWLTAGEAPLRLLGGERGARGTVQKEEADAWAVITERWYEAQEAKRRADLLELVRLVDELTAPGRDTRDAGTHAGGECAKQGCGVLSGAPEKAARPPVRLPLYLPPPTYGWWVSGAARYQRGTPFPHALEKPPWA